MSHARSSFSAILISSIAALILASGCTDNTTPAAPSREPGSIEQVPPDVQKQIDELQAITASPDRGFDHWITLTAKHHPVVLPAGSVDALAAAIAAAGNNGMVILETGDHTENGTVTVTSTVKIVGQTGAVLKSGLSFSNDTPEPAEPAIHVLGARGVVITNIDFQPVSGVANTGVLLEQSPRSIVLGNTFTHFQLSILLHYSDSSTILGNTVVSAQGGDVVESDGIINMNGNDVRIVGNDVSNGLLGIFCSGTKGYYLFNTTHENFVGVILCKVPEGALLLPGGDIVGSDVSAKNWLAQGNHASNNAYAGYLVIDGANNNLLVNNDGSGNGAYDMELLGETCLFGFSTPTSFDNTVVASNTSMTINDFGQNNRIFGTTTVTHDITVPCP